MQLSEMHRVFLGRTFHDRVSCITIAITAAQTVFWSGQVSSGLTTLRLVNVVRARIYFNAKFESWIKVPLKHMTCVEYSR